MWEFGIKKDCDFGRYPLCQTQTAEVLEYINSSST